MRMKARTWRIRLVVLTVLLLFSVASLFPVCVQAQRYTRYILTVSVNDPGAGTVTPTFGTYSYGDVVTLTERPNEGYMFDGWFVNGISQGKMSTLILTMYRNYDVVASFSRRQAKLTITTNPLNGGSTAPSADVWLKDYGSSVLVKEYPNPGKVFDGWFLDGTYVGNAIEYTVLMDMDHKLDAYFANEQTVRPPPNQDENKTHSVIEFSCKSSASYASLSADIRGALSSNGKAIAGAPILISYSVTAGESWTDLTLVDTDAQGNFRATWMPQVTGDYKIRTVWNGNATFAKTNATIDFAMAPFGQESVFSITSNSTLTQLAFNSNSSQFSFSVSGPSGTTGYVYVYIPKTLMGSTANLTVWMDQRRLTPTVQSDGDAWLVYFAYSHSEHFVTLDLIGATLSIPETANNNLLLYIIPVIIITIVAVLGVIALKKRRKT